MSDPVPEVPVFRQLQGLVRALGDELASFRRRAQLAEARVRHLEAALAAGGDVDTLDRLRSLEAENADLKARLVVATDQTRTLLARVKFMRQQHARASIPATNTAGSAS